MQHISARKPTVFKDNHTPKVFSLLSTSITSHRRQSVACDLGCKCQRSRCLKKYCICYERQTTCSNSCKCIGCLNNDQAVVNQRLDSTAEKPAPLPKKPVRLNEPVEKLQEGKIALIDPNDSLISLPKLAEIDTSRLKVSPQSKTQHQTPTASTKNTGTLTTTKQDCMWLSDRTIIPEKALLMILRFLGDSDVTRFSIVSSSTYQAAKEWSQS